jgi:transitional endoplasmic reticulum ATPase
LKNGKYKLKVIQFIMTQDTWFDAFFRAVTSSPEFKKAVDKDYVWDFKESFKNVSEKLKKVASEKEEERDFINPFDTQEARDIWNSYYSEPYMTKTGDTSDDAFLQVKYFKKDDTKDQSTWWFAWVAGMEDLKQELRESFIKPLKFKFLVEKLEQNSSNEEEILSSDKAKKSKDKGKDDKDRLNKLVYEAYKKFNVSIPTGLLFYGPPWTGKTFITKKLAEELEAGFIQKSVWEFGSSYMHQTSQNIKKFFDAAKRESQKWPMILFLDEIDSLVSKRTNNIDANKAEEVSQFLQEFNTLEEEAPNLIVIAATNRPDHLDSAILRSGRFDKKFYIWAPDFIARKELFIINIEKKWLPSEKLDYDKLATLTDGYVSADIEMICNEAARDASKSILDLANSLNDEGVDLTAIEASLWKHTITQKLLEEIINKTESSIRYTDMSIYDEWLEKSGDKEVKVVERV